MNGEDKPTQLAIVNGAGRIIGVIRKINQSQIKHETDGTILYKPFDFESYDDEELERMFNSAVSSVFIGSRYYIIR